MNSYVLRWAILTAGLMLAGVGMALLWGIGWGLITVGIGVVLIMLVYDPDRGASDA